MTPENYQTDGAKLTTGLKVESALGRWAGKEWALSDRRILGGKQSTDMRKWGKRLNERGTRCALGSCEGSPESRQFGVSNRCFML
jgi:hypothetical protein